MSTKWIALWKIYSITCTHILKLLHTCYFYQSLHTFASLIVLNTASKNRLINWVQSQTVFIHYSKISYCEMPLLLVKLKNMKNNVRFSHQKSIFILVIYSNDFFGQKEMAEILDYPLSLIAFNCTSWTGMCILAKMYQKVTETVAWNIL